MAGKLIKGQFLRVNIVLMQVKQFSAEIWPIGVLAFITHLIFPTNHIPSCVGQIGLPGCVSGA